MFAGLQLIDEVIDTLERDISAEPDYAALAARMALSVYEFRRIFAFVVGVPISEYLRRRRLSLAACELISRPEMSIGEVGEKYGYATASSFSKAFSEQHGASPSACRAGECEIRIFSRPRFDFSIKAPKAHSFRVIHDTAFAVSGYSAISEHTDSCCCDRVWTDFYRLGWDERLSGNRIYASYESDGGYVRCTLGDRVAADSADASAAYFPDCRYLSVSMDTTDDGIVNEKYSSILYDLLPSAALRRRADLPTLEIFPKDMSEDGFIWEIRIPIE